MIRSRAAQSREPGRRGSFLWGRLWTTGDNSPGSGDFAAGTTGREDLNPHCCGMRLDNDHWREQPF